MKNYSDKVFEMLDIKPYQPFRLMKADDGTLSRKVYRIRLDLYLEESDGHGWVSSMISIAGLLNGVWQLDAEHSKILTNSDLTVIKYLLLSGYKYIARNNNGKVKAFKVEPQKGLVNWFVPPFEQPPLPVEAPVTFCSWSDLKATDLEDLKRCLSDNN